MKPRTTRVCPCAALKRKTETFQTVIVLIFSINQMKELSCQSRLIIVYSCGGY